MVFVILSGSTKLHSLEENLGAAYLNMMADDLGEIDVETPKIEVQDERLPEAILKVTGQ